MNDETRHGMKHINVNMKWVFMRICHMKTTHEKLLKTDGSYKMGSVLLFHDIDTKRLKTMPFQTLCVYNYTTFLVKYLKQKWWP